MNISRISAPIALALFLMTPLAHADLIPPGGEGVNACRDKKAGTECENYVIEETGMRREPGTCVEEKLDHLHFKFKAHLRCVSPSVPVGGVSRVKPPPSAAPSANAPPIPSAITSAAPEAPAPIASTNPPVESPKSGSCSWTADPSSGLAICSFLLGLGVLFGARRRNR